MIETVKQFNVMLKKYLVGNIFSEITVDGFKYPVHPSMTEIFKMCSEYVIKTYDPSIYRNMFEAYSEEEKNNLSYLLNNKENLRLKYDGVSFDLKNKNVEFSVMTYVYKDGENKWCQIFDFCNVPLDFVLANDNIKKFITKIIDSMTIMVENLDFSISDYTFIDGCRKEGDIYLVQDIFNIKVNNKFVLLYEALVSRK